MSINTLTIFHRADYDGLACEAIARRALNDTSHYLGFDYGDPIPDLASYSKVYLLDISLPIEVMRENASKIILCDHHKTLLDAVASFKDSFLGYYCIDGVAASRLTWQFFHRVKQDGILSKLPEKQAYLDRGVDEPYAIQLIGEYDIWRKDNPSTDLFQLGIQADPSPDWNTLLGNTTETVGYIDYLIRSGQTIQRYTDTINAQIATERGFDLQWEGFYWRCLNTARCNSLTFTAALRPEHDGCLAYHWNGKHWKFSFYGVPHKPDLDLSVVAKKHGGGGHAQSCGCQLLTLPKELGGSE